MNIRKNRKIGITIIFLTTLVFSTYFGLLPKMINYQSNDNSGKNIEKYSPIASQIGEDAWWNASYQWRQCINVTNPGGYNLTDNWVKVSFNYQTLVSSGKMQADLKDIRIVENGNLRNYYVRKDFPSTYMATAWFQTSITEYTTEYDTYMYYGNDSVGIASGYYAENCPGGNGQWNFEEGSGTTAYDSISSYNASLFGSPAPTYVPGRIGDYALQFNGVNDYAAIQKLNFTERNEIKQLTVSAWFKTSYTGGSYSSNWAFFDFDRSEYFNFYIRPDDGQIGFSTSAYGYSGQDDFESAAATPLNDGQWHFACIVYDGSDKIIYLDGGVENNRENNVYNGAGLGTGTPRYGFMGDGSEASTYNGNRNNIYYDGSLDDVRYFNYSLTSNDIKWLANYYPISTNLLSIVERSATVSVYVNDVDGRRVPNAEVALWNGSEILSTPSVGEFIQTTDNSGYTAFTGVPFGDYNITVNYTLPSGSPAIVYDSRITGGEIEFMGLFTNVTLYTDLWTIDFEVVDVDGQPLNYGYIEVNDSLTVLQTLTLNAEGKATFTWLNTSEYYYMVYYNNTDYNIENPTLIDFGTISRVDTNTTYYVKEENLNNPANPTYSVNKDTFAPGSSLGNPGNLTVIDAKVEFTNMQDKMNDVSIWFMDSVGYRFEESKVYSGTVTDDSFFYHPRYDVPFDVYGLRFQVSGSNTTTCNGKIEVILTHDYLEHIVVPMAKLDIQVIDNTTTYPVEGVTVKVERDSPGSPLVTNLKTDDTGFAFGQVNNNLQFWYKTGWTYNFSLWIASARYSFFVNTSDQSFKPGLYDKNNDEKYNYTLLGHSLLVFGIDLNFQQRITTFANGSLTYDNNVFWGQNTTFSVNFTYSGDGGINWNPDNGAGTVITCTIISIQLGYPTVYSAPMAFIGSGIYSIELNSSMLSAGNNGKSYLVKISGTKEAYFSPSAENFIITIKSLPTGMALYNYSSLALIPSNRLSQYYNNDVNVTLMYFDNNTGNPLVADSMSYKWDYGMGSINPDPLNPGYYTFELSTSSAPNTGNYVVEISANRENYTEIGGIKNTFDVYLEIVARPTSINGTTTLFQQAPVIYVLEAHNYSYVYRDTLTGSSVGNLDLATYNWYKLDASGNPLSGPGNEGSGTLVETTGNRYVLDFNTETRDVGQYTIFISLQKDNYEVRNAFMALTIDNRPIGVNFTATGKSDGRINVVKGKNIDFTVTLRDPTAGNALLDNVTVTLTIKGVEYNLVETSPGVYTFSYSTNSIDAFFMPNTISGCTITFNKQYYEVNPENFVIVVGMDEIFPGFPMFYFLLIVIGVVAVVGSIVTYRAVQQAKIPKFVKKVRSMKKEIKGRKSISDSLLYPAKEEYVVKELSDKWNMIGLSLEEILGLETKKRKKMPEVPENEGGVE